MKSISIYRANAVLLLGILFFIVLYYGRTFLIPLAFAILFGMLLLPASRKLESWGLSRIGATLLCLCLILLFVAVILGIIAAQVAVISKDLPQLQVKLQQQVDVLQQWVQQQFSVSPEKQIEFLKSQISKFSQSANKFGTSLIAGGASILSGFALMLLYFFFLMWKREKYQQFFLKLTAPENKPDTEKELHEITKVASQYVIGRLISMAFLAFVYTIGFSVVGLKNAILISLVTVIPTIIPYVGSIVGSLFPLIMATVSGGSNIILPVILVIVIAQVLDNNVIEPLVEGSALHISPIFTIVAIVLGELVWGVAGMILFIPLFAVLRIICDHHPALHPYGFLLANDVEEPQWLEKVKGWFKKEKS